MEDSTELMIFNLKETPCNYAFVVDLQSTRSLPLHPFKIFVMEKCFLFLRKGQGILINFLFLPGSNGSLRPGLLYVDDDYDTY
jgi:hypothetical protein